MNYKVLQRNFRDLFSSQDEILKHPFLKNLKFFLTKSEKKSKRATVRVSDALS